MGFSERVSRTCFNWVHQHNLVYNTCWEDPRVDREALNLTGRDTVLMITSAGCNALDYALQGPRQIYAVDMNPHQNALLELKMAAIRRLDYERFFELFGQGGVADWDTLYRQELRPALSATSRLVWDRCGRMFASGGRRSSFYFRGSSGLFAWFVNAYINRVIGVREAVNDMLSAQTLEEQQEIFFGRNLNHELWRPIVLWCLRRDTTLSMLGVPRSQRRQLDEGYAGGIARFVQDRVEEVFTRKPLHDNYFWRVYLTGRYTPDCCPEYLKEENFSRLRNDAVDRISTHTDSLLGFLRHHRGSISRFVLLDHMDWLYRHDPGALAAEWQAIIDHAAPQCRVIWRSAGLKVEFVNPITVQSRGSARELGRLLRYEDELSQQLHVRDRVNTYGSFSIADLLAA